ncbi:MAG: hypothetical protein KDD56_09090, partial [Bdellovibrionales bacterium]|nr:hypothetical protein [Bdellovibrionales bacterium]
LNLVNESIELIDMNNWIGNHPCIGAADVIPITPLGSASIEDADKLAFETVKRLAEFNTLPMYFQNLNDTINTKRNLHILRKSGFKGLSEQFKIFPPDYGSNTPHPTAGALIIGARNFLVPINFNLDTEKINIAMDLAKKIRTSGNSKPGGQGLFQDCMAIGWYVKEFDCAQVSTNLTNYKITPPHLVFEALKELAYDLGVKVTGSEVIGLIPEDSLKMAAKYYFGETDLDKSMLAAIDVMGLNSVKDFTTETKLIEKRLEKVSGIKL